MLVYVSDDKKLGENANKLLIMSVFWEYNKQEMVKLHVYCQHYIFMIFHSEFCITDFFKFYFLAVFLLKLVKNTIQDALYLSYAVVHLLTFSSLTSSESKSSIS